MVLGKIGKPASDRHDDQSRAKRGRRRRRMIHLVGVSRSGDGENERPVRNCGRDLVGTLDQNGHRDDVRSERSHDQS